MGGSPRRTRTQARCSRGLEEKEEEAPAAAPESPLKIRRSLRPSRSLRPCDRSLRPAITRVSGQDSGHPRNPLWKFTRSLVRSPHRSLCPGPESPPINHRSLRPKCFACMSELGLSPCIVPTLYFVPRIPLARGWPIYMPPPPYVNPRMDMMMR